MKKVSSFEAKTHFSALIDTVMTGETVVVTKNGVPVARIMPIESGVPREFGVARQLFAKGAIRVDDVSMHRCRRECCASCADNEIFARHERAVILARGLQTH